jgi:hypothetical protein
VAQRDLAKAYLGLSETSLAARDIDAAMRYADAAKATLEPVVERNAGDAEPRRDMAMVENARGVVLKTRGDQTAAQAAWLHSVSLLEPAVQPTNDRTLLDPWVRALVYMGRVDQAVASHKTLVSLCYRDVSYLRVWDQYGRRAN